MRNKAFQIMVVILAGFLASVVPLEGILHIVLGSPWQKILKSHQGYFEYEFYRPFFGKTRTADGRVQYETLRNRTTKERFFAQKMPKTKRIFIAGESAAFIFGGSRDRFLDALRQQIPGYDFEIISAAAPGYESCRISLIVKEILNYSPDLLLLFVGNNINRPFHPNPWISNDAGRFLYEHVWLYCAAVEVWERIRQSIFPGQATAQGNDVILRKNLEEMIAACATRKVPIVLFTLPTNARDFPPFDHTVPDDMLSNREYFLAWLAVQEGKHDEAQIRLRGLMKNNRYERAELYYLLARAAEAGNELESARECYDKAVQYDTDPLAYRSPRARNEIIRRLAAEKRALLVDVEKLFMKMADNGLVGDEFFRDSCHWWLVYNDCIIGEIIRNLYRHDKECPEKAFAEPGSWNYRPPVEMRRNEIRRRVANEVQDLKTIQGWERFGMEPVLQFGSDRFVEPVVYWFKKVNSARPGFLDRVVNSEDEMGELIKMNEWSVSLKDRFAGRWPEILWYIGEAFREQGNDSLALRYFDRAIAENSVSIYPYLFRGLIHFKAKAAHKAREDWEKVAAKDNRFSWLPALLQ